MKLFICIVALAAAAMAGSDLEKILHDSNVQFSSRMFSEVTKSKPGQSVVLSAFSVLSPLAQLALASVGASHDELLKTIGFPNDNVTKEVFADVNKRLGSVPGIELKLSNRIYVTLGAVLNDQFAAVSRDTFGSDVKSVDFGKNVETAAEINKWVEDSTNNRIKDLVDPDSLDADTAAILVNAIYFKGKWKSPFNKGLTSDRDFYVTKDKIVKVPMMYQSDDFKYGESKELDAKLLEMAYEGESSSLLIVLPNEVDGIHSLTEKLGDPSVLEKAVQSMSKHEVEVTIPKFKIETTTDLKEVLQKLGCTKLFKPGQARLNNLLKGEYDLYISKATQKAYIEVNEEGAEAAAANLFIIVAESAILNSKRFEADKPFYYELRHDKLTLFSGVIIQPSYQ